MKLKCVHTAFENCIVDGSSSSSSDSGPDELILVSPESGTRISATTLWDHISGSYPGVAQ